ncbi:hypothetical protein MNBD_GAMMA05-634 [hydrothermal vent metagenome]|uniref:Glycosyltransferase n=1 Tax=hydrothermal vent metagenome TaxID=652676 RepID=A0A3B0WL86_9ZZZZ
MKNILYAFKDFDEKGGAEKNLIEVAEHASLNNKISFIISSGQNSEKLVALGTVFTFPSKGNKLLFILDIIFLFYIVLFYRINIIHSHHRYPSFIASLIKPVTSFKLLTTVHNVFPDKESFSNWGDHAIAVSKSVYNWVIASGKYCKNDVTVVYNGITTPDSYQEVDYKSLKNEISYDYQLTYLCSVGRLSEQKNYTLLFQLLAELKRTDWRLLLVGDGEQREQLTKQASSLDIDNNIIFLGQRDDVDKIMQLSDIFVLSSKWEGFPYVVIEALSNGLPVISTDVGGIHEAITNGDTGYLFNIDDDNNNYIYTLEKLISDSSLRDKMSVKCKKMFIDNFIISKMFESTDEIYSKL